MDFEYGRVNHIVAVVAMTENDFQEQVGAHADFDKEDLYPTVIEPLANSPTAVRRHVSAMLDANVELEQYPYVGHTVVINYDQHTLYVWFQA